MTPEPRTAVNGYGRHSWYIAAAWGTLFIPDIRWNDENPEMFTTGVGSTGSLGEITNPLLGELFARGLADAVTPTLLNGLNRSQLTYFSSPVTGCGVAAICVPTELGVNIDVISSDVAAVCSITGSEALAVATTTEWNTALLAPTHIFGAWNGKNPSTFPAANYGTVIGYAGEPELVGGQLSTRQTLLYLIDSRGTVFNIAGARAQIGADSETLTGATINVDNITELFNGEWSRCD